MRLKRGEIPLLLMQPKFQIHQLSWYLQIFVVQVDSTDFSTHLKRLAVWGANPYEEYRPRGLFSYPGDVSQRSRAPWCCSFSPGKKLRPRINSLRPCWCDGSDSPARSALMSPPAWGCCRLHKPRVAHPRARKVADVPLVVRDQLVVVL